MTITDFEFQFTDLVLKYAGVTASGSAQIIVRRDDWEIGDILVGDLKTLGWMLKRDEALYTLIENALYKNCTDDIWQCFYEKTA